MFSHSASHSAASSRGGILAIGVICAGVLMSGALGVSPVDAAPTATAKGRPVADVRLPADNPEKGVVHKGLTPGRPDGPCAGLLELNGGGSSARCTHGPDAAPPGVDVRRPRSVEDVALTTNATGARSNGSAGVPCYGDGASGNRIQAVYAHSSDVPDRFAELAPMFPQWAATADGIFDRSAAKTGGSRHLRWVTDANCALSVINVTLSPTGDDSLGNTQTELQALGMNGSDRKYLVWVDNYVYCGIANIKADDQPGAANGNNFGPTFARVDAGCWGDSSSIESHEIMHTLGGVQPSAPHASAAWHCTDDYDVMCYADGVAVIMAYPCANKSNEVLFDCGNDDYFHTAPSPGSYLATHWNTAMSAFLETVDPGGATTVIPPAGSTTSTWSGSFKGNTSSRGYSTSSGSGTMTLSSTFTGGASVTMMVTDSVGAVVDGRSGPSGFEMSVPVSAGNYTVTINGTKNTSYSLVATYPTP